MKCLFCDYELEFNAHGIAYCHGHKPISVLFALDRTSSEIHFYLLSNKIHRAIVYPNQYFEIDGYFTDNEGKLHVKSLTKIYEACQLTPTNFESKIKSFLVFL